MLLRKDYEMRERDVLAPYAMLSGESRGREYKEPACRFRSAFQRDRDRIIHSEAFRRLEYKTQVFVNHEGDYYRTRLTHTLEVAQISRGIARSLRLNEDLAETIALAHDLGHTPFGHSGEEALDNIMKKFGDRFEHNEQSLRVVTKLEYRYPEFPGLNLSFEVLDGISKHDEKRRVTLEAEIVNLADEIAYINHDLDDGLKSGLLKFKQLREVPLWQKLFKEVRPLYPTVPESIWKYQIIRRLIYLFVTDLQANIKHGIEKKKIRTIEDVNEKGRELSSFSLPLQSEISNLNTFLTENLYHHPRVRKEMDKATKIIDGLFDKYLKKPNLIPALFNRQIKATKERRICDYIAGMTDRYASDKYERLI